MQCTVQNHLMLVLSSECSVSDAERKERNLDWERSLRGIQRGPHLIHLGNTRSDLEMMFDDVRKPLSLLKNPLKRERLSESKNAVVATFLVSTASDRC